MKITTVFFDLGSTLVYDPDPWPPIQRRADRAMLEALAGHGLKPDPEKFFGGQGGFIDHFYAQPFTGDTQISAMQVLDELLKQSGFPGTPEATLREALDALYAVTIRNWHREEDALSTLEALKQAGFHMGVISNTSDDQNVKMIVDREGLRPYFEQVLTSAALGIRKPDQRIFQAALDHFQVPANETVMVGDRLEADILGANRMGMYSIWITRRVQVRGEGELEVQPQAAVSALAQLPALLEEIQRE